MSIYLYSVALLVVVTGSALYWTRDHWQEPLIDGFYTTVDRMPWMRSISAYIPVPTTFEGDVEAGLTSTNFDLSGNVGEGDSRAGLDDESKAAILAIMKRRRMTFDAARKVFMERRFRENGIGADGRPRDPKFVSFS